MAMRVYARPSLRLAFQLVADLSVAIWIIVWWQLSTWVTTTVNHIAAPSRQVGSTMRNLRANVGSAADSVGDIPYVGGSIRSPFDAIATDMSGVIDATDEQVAAIEHAAVVLGWAAFLIPVGMVLAFWLPLRIRFLMRTMRVAQLAAEPYGTELLAFRALANAPLRVIAAIPNAAEGYRSRDPHTLAVLADTECRRLGVAPRPR